MSSGMNVQMSQTKKTAFKLNVHQKASMDLNPSQFIFF